MPGTAQGLGAGALQARGSPGRTGVMWPMALLQCFSLRDTTACESPTWAPLPVHGLQALFLLQSGPALLPSRSAPFLWPPHPLWVWTHRHQWLPSDLHAHLPTDGSREAHSPAAFHASLPRPQPASLPTSCPRNHSPVILPPKEYFQVTMFSILTALPATRQASLYGNHVSLNISGI